MASEDLLKKAVAAFNALSSEQQAEMLEEQRQSWVRGNVGLSRDERGMNTPVAPVSPDATGKCGELVTVLTQSRARRYMEGEGGPWGDWKDGPALTPPPYFQVEERELCDRSQADELLTAERAEKEQAKDDLTRVLVHFVREHFPENTTFKPLDDIIGLITQFDNASTIAREYVSRIRSLEADNAELTARIKELEEQLENMTAIKDIHQEKRAENFDRVLEAEAKVEALEAKLAAAEKALEAIEDHAARCFSLSTHSTIALAYLQDIQDEARAVLGGKP